MDLKEIKRKIEDPSVTDKAVIRCVIEEMLQLPTSTMYKDEQTVERSGRQKSLREAMLADIAGQFKLNPKDTGLPVTYGDLAYLISRYRVYMRGKGYDCGAEVLGQLLKYIAQMQRGFMIKTIGKENAG